jgi:hypothetical protein
VRAPAAIAVLKRRNKTDAVLNWLGGLSVLAVLLYFGFHR